MTTYIDHILDVAELNRLIAEKYISQVRSADALLTLFNYTEKATFDRVWTPETRACRGLIMDTMTGAIVARPFEKFSNVNEAAFPESSLDALRSRPGPVEFTDKLDGSMIAIWWNPHTEAWQCSTRGSFTSTQALAAQAWLAPYISKWNWPRDFTILGEWCAPDNRIVLKYDRAELRLIGIRHANGYDAPHAELSDWAALVGLPVVPIVDGGDLDALCGQRGTLAGVEGWVARWPDGFRVKIKTEDYLRLHRIVSLFSPARVLEAMIAGDNYISVLPEELRGEAEAIEAAILEAAAHRSNHLTASFNRLRPLLSEGRKAFAMAVLQEPADDRPFLFSLADNKPVREKILQSIDLDALIPAA